MLIYKKIFITLSIIYKNTKIHTRKLHDYIMNHSSSYSINSSLKYKEAMLLYSLSIFRIEKTLEKDSKRQTSKSQEKASSILSEYIYVRYYKYFD